MLAPSRCVGEDSPMAKQSTEKPKPQPPTEEAIAANKLVMRFLLLMGVTLLTGMLALPLQLIAIGFAVWATIAGIKALRAAWAAKIRGSMIVFTSIALGLTITLGISTALVLARWDVEMGYQTCKDQAITNTASIDCTKDYDKKMDDYLKGLTLR